MPALLLLVMLASAGGDPIAPGRDALHELEYERALTLLTPVAENGRLPKQKRAQAYVLIAQAHFGIAEPDAENRVRSAFRQAFRLDSSVDLVDRKDLSPKLVAVFDEMRDKLGKRDRDDRKDPEPKPKIRPPERGRLDDDVDPTAPSTTDVNRGNGNGNGNGNTNGEHDTDDDAHTAPAAASTPLPLPWLVTAGVGSAAALVGTGLALGAESWLGAVPTDASGDDVRGVQGVGVAGVVVAAVGVGVAIVGGLGVAAAGP